MTNAGRHVVASAIVLAGIATPSPPAVAAGDESVTHDTRVRSSHAGIAALIARATEQSHTFRSMVETIGAGKGIVYIEDGRCGQGVRACLVNVHGAGAARILFVKVDIRKADQELMASIGHELRHVIEVLDNPGVRNYSTLYLFYQRVGIRGTSGAFETPAAVEAGVAVKAELRQFECRGKGN